MHLVIVSTPRAGAHMVRSMLAADPAILDLGAIMSPLDDGPVQPVSGRFGDVARTYSEILEGYPGRLPLTHLKLSLGHFEAIRAAAHTGGRFLFLHRRDRLRQVCSFLFALRNGTLVGPAGTWAPIAPARHQVEALQEEFARLERLGRLYLEATPCAELAYEEIGVDTLHSAIAALGLEVSVGQPTTSKSSPLLADYVTNISELI